MKTYQQHSPFRFVHSMKTTIQAIVVGSLVLTGLPLTGRAEASPTPSAQQQPSAAIPAAEKSPLALLSKAADTGPSYSDQIKAKLVFPSLLEWVGPQEPSAAESMALLGAIGTLETNGVKAGFAALEGFMSASPQSAWTPSLRVNMAEYYRSHGRYSLALAHWEAAWKATKNGKDAATQKLAVRAVTGWTRLLASLGQKDQAKALFKEMDELQLPPGAYGNTIISTKGGLAVMNAKPGDSYRCGSFALGHVAEALHLDKKTSLGILQTKSPDGGFHVSELLALAESNNIPLFAVRRPLGSEIVVPAIVHWKLNHYAAITERNGDRYRVMDPTFGGHVWMDAESIEAEASGAFLLPKDKAPATWQKLSKLETESIYGKGYPNDFPYPDDGGPPPGCDGSDDEDADCNPPSANDGASGGDNDPPPPPCCDGMPQWSVSEPYISLWLQDAPLFYRLSSGKLMRLRLSYKQRDDSRGGLVSGFGTQWECNWLGMMQSQSGTPDVYTNYLAGGGLRPFSTDGTVEYKSARKMSIILEPGQVPVLSGPTGSQNHYAYAQGTLTGTTNYFLTHRMDRYGRTIHFNYGTFGTSVRLTNVFDIDGRTNTLAYTNTTFTNLITSVTDPYSRSAYFIYDNSGRLTNITDMAGMSSSFTYDTNNNITAMITPYGTNTFASQSVKDAGDLYALRNALLVTEPTGDKQLYAYRDNSPDNTQDVVHDGTASYRMSYHWNRFQCAAISAQGQTNYLDMPAVDYQKASVKHWLHGPWNGGDIVSDTLDSMSDPYDPRVSLRPNAFCFTYPAGGTKRVTSITSQIATVKTITRTSLGRPEVTTYCNFNLDGSAYSTASYTNIYDGGGQYLQRELGPRGEQVRGYGYHPIITNLLISVTNEVGDVTRYTHDTNTMKVTSITFPGGLVRTNIYYTSGTNVGFLQAQIDIGFRTNSFTYQNGNVYVQTNELGLVTTNTWDKLNRLVCTTYPDQTTLSNSYDKLDIVGTKDRLGQWTHYGFNRVRQLVAVTNVNSQVTQYDYCSCGAPSQITRWNGATPLITTFAYDLGGRLTNALYPDLYQLSYLYDMNNLRTNIADNAGHQWTIAYRQLGESYKPTCAYLVSASDPSDRRLVFSQQYDEYGRLTNSLNRNGVTVTNDYDFAGRLVARQSFGSSGLQVSGVESFVYNALGLTNYTDSLGHLTTCVLDATRRELFETNANHQVTQYTYDGANNLLSLVDGKNQTTHWNYDEFGQVTNKVDATGTEIFRYRYDANGRLTNRWSVAKGNTGYGYDPLGNLTSVVYSNATVAWSYDGVNRMTNMVDGAGTTSFGWTDGGQLASETGPWAADKVSYAYNGRQRSGLSVQQPNASAWAQGYTYDTFARLTNVTSPAGVFGLQYAPVYYQYSTAMAADLVQELDLPNQALSYRTYDDLGRLLQVALTNAAATLVELHGYGYDLGSQRTQQVFTAGNFVNYGYDNIGQLVSAQGMESGGVTNRAGEQFGYAYDLANNLSNRTNNVLVQTFNVNSLNELSSASRSGTFTVAGTVSLSAPPVSVTVSGTTGLSSGAATVYADGTWARTNATLASGANIYTATATDGLSRSSQDSVSVNLPATNSFSYDGNGNLTNDGLRSFEYDAENQLTNVYVSLAWRSEFKYDGLLRRRVRREYTWQGSTWLQTNEVRYVYDGNLVIQERDINNLPQVTYTRGNDLSRTLQDAGGIGGLLARTDHAVLNSGSPQLAHAFYHFDGNGNVTCMINASNVVVASYNYDPFGNILSKSGALAEANLYRFSSKEQHPNSGLSYYLYRFYDPNIQRWVNRDPIQENGGINQYQFVFNEPIERVDLYGLSAADVDKILDTCKKTIKELTDAGKRSNNGELNNLENMLGDKKKLGCGEQAAYLAGKLQKTQTDDSWTINSPYVHLFPSGVPHQFLILKSDNDKDPILYLDPWAGTCGKKPPSNVIKIDSIDKLGTTDCCPKDKDKEKKQ
ncbi:MAG: putative rhs-related protein [Pedosphaera sp.]|nr:putative rhs-related protein [Pedosphaera sp.]